MQYQITATRDGRIMVFGVQADNKPLAVIEAVKFLTGAPWTIKAKMIAPRRYRDAIRRYRDAI